MTAKIKYVFFMLLILNVGLLLYYFNQRDAFHTDELWSYGHANSTHGAYLSPKIDSFMTDVNGDISYKWLNGKVFHNYLSVQKGEQFSYFHIWENLSLDVHPPLYFILLHTVCSFFPDVFSKWHGGALNILFFALTLLMLYRLSKIILADDLLALMPVFLWGFSNVGIATAMYLRMYMKQTFFAVWLMYETLLMLSENKVDFKRLSLIFLASFLGIFTQYNSLFFSFFVTSGSCFILLLRKNWRLLCIYGIVMLLSAGALFVFFPAVIDVLFHSSRGEEVQHLLNDKKFSVLFWLLHLERPFEIYFTDLLSFKDIYISAATAMIILIFTSLCNREKNSGVRFLLFVALAVSVALAVLMPQIWMFWQRYIMFIMPFFAILTVYLIIRGGVYLALPRRWIAVCCGVIVLANSLTADFCNRSAFHFQYNKKVSGILNGVQHKRIFVVSPVWAFFGGVSLYMNNDEVFRTDNLYHNSEERKSADYVFVYNALVKNFKMYDRQPALEQSDIPDLKYITTLPLTFDLMFDVYKVTQTDNEQKNALE